MRFKKKVFQGIEMTRATMLQVIITMIWLSLTIFEMGYTVWSACFNYNVESFLIRQRCIQRKNTNTAFY